MTGPAALAIPRARCSPQEQHGLLVKFEPGWRLVGADMARKFLQMGYSDPAAMPSTRAAANTPRGTGDPLKSEIGLDFL